MRQPDIIRPIKLTTTLPEDIRARLDIHLYSPLEERIPKGAYQQFFIERIREYFDTKTLDLSQYCRVPSRGMVIRGSETSINLLRDMLRGVNYDQS